MNENQRIRGLFEEMIKQHGLKMKFMSQQLSLENTTVSKWRNGHLDYGETKLRMIEKFIENYNK